MGQGWGMYQIRFLGVSHAWTQGKRGNAYPGEGRQERCQAEGGGEGGEEQEAVMMGAESSSSQFPARPHPEPCLRAFQSHLCVQHHLKRSPLDFRREQSWPHTGNKEQVRAWTPTILPDSPYPKPLPAIAL